MANRFDTLKSALGRVPKPVWYGVGALAVLWIFRKSAKKAATTTVEAAKEVASEVVEDIRGILDRGRWAKSMYTSVSKALPSVSVTGRLMIVAQAITESGWTGGKAAKEGFNYWNLTAGPSWTGPVFVDVGGDRSYQKSECSRQGKPMNESDGRGKFCRIDQKWRKYPNLNAAILDFWGFIGNARYTGAQQALLAGNIRGYVDILANGGYFDPAVREQYYSNMVSIVGSVKKRVE